jgi:catechol 2,3-dioxygenase-like lactoylglutathione lyase family enzyme
MIELMSVLPVLRVTDMDQSVQFYGQVLGFEVVWRAPIDEGGENCMLRSGQVDLLLSTGSHLGEPPAFTGTLYFSAAGTAELYEAVREAVEIVWPLSQMADGTSEFGLRDPDGYVLAVTEIPAAAVPPPPPGS